MRAFWVRTPLLLILTALAISGAAGNWHVWGSSPAAGWVGADQAGHPGWSDAHSAPEQPALLGSSRGLSVTIGAREPGDGPASGLSRYARPAAAIAPRLHYDLVALGLLVAARSQLSFAYHAVMLRSGAYSAFGTSIPPPLLA